MSQNSGRAPARAMVPAVAKNVNGLVITPSPGADAERHEREQQRVGARGDADAEAALAVGGHRRLELLDRRTRG